MSSPQLPTNPAQREPEVKLCPDVPKHFCIRGSETWLLKKPVWKTQQILSEINQIQLERASNQPRNLFCGLNVSFEKSCKKWYFSRTENIFVIYQKVHILMKKSDLWLKIEMIEIQNFELVTSKAKFNIMLSRWLSR